MADGSRVQYVVLFLVGITLLVGGGLVVMAGVVGFAGFCEGQHPPFSSGRNTCGLSNQLAAMPLPATVGTMFVALATLAAGVWVAGRGLAGLQPPPAV